MTRLFIYGKLKTSRNGNPNERRLNSTFTGRWIVDTIELEAAHNNERRHQMKVKTYTEKHIIVEDGDGVTVTLDIEDGEPAYIFIKDGTRSICIGKEDITLIEEVLKVFRKETI